ncbi:MAG: undecaprenyl/decaprenyl-phosphate alpha-N-acetylglucosaminyl 1-phosphate transferase [Nocardia sp.]|nr:undecaprenyl/decaprenyl-phosphate alpha-N-acetylglucosaminyl 1-phosphate transferase [Nocardia sp.]
MVWAGISAFVLVGGLTELIRRLAIRCALIDHPNAHKGHERPTPYLGGIGIVIGVLTPTLLVMGDERLAVMVAAAAAVSGIGLIDDLLRLSPATRLVAETLAAVVVVAVYGGVGIAGHLDDLIGVLWIVVMTNSFNLLDNMDGMAAGVAYVTSTVLSLSACMVGQPDVGMLLLALSCGCAGFLPHNWNPARIFMGDAGSLFIGFVISSSTFVIYTHSGRMTTITGALLTTFVATVDTALVFISRYRAGRPLLLGGTDHASHRLRQLGFRPRQVAFALSGTAAVSSLGGITVLRGWIPAFVLLTIATAFAAVLVWLLLNVPVYPSLKGPSSGSSTLGADEWPAASVARRDELGRGADLHRGRHRGHLAALRRVLRPRSGGRGDRRAPQAPDAGGQGRRRAVDVHRERGVGHRGG